MANVDDILSGSAEKAIRGLDKAVTDLDKTYMKLADDIEKGAINLRDYKGSADIVSKALKELEQRAKEKTKADQQQADAERKVTQFNEEQAKSIEKSKRALQEKQKAAKALSIIEDEEAGTLEKLTARNAILRQEIKKLNLETLKGRQELKKKTAEIDKNTAFIKKNSDAYVQQKMNIGNYKSALEGLPGPIGSATRAGNTFLATLKKIAANPIVLIITLLVGALAGLVAIFKSTDDGGTKMAAMFDRLRAVMDVIKRRIVVLIDGFKALFSGKFREAGEKFKESVKGMGEEMKAASDAAYELVYAMDALNDRQTAFISEQAKVRNQIERLQAISKDVTKSDQERIKALEESLILEEGLAAKKRNFAEEELNNLVAREAIKANIDAETLKNFIALNSDEQTAARETSEVLAAAWNVLGDESIKAMEEAYAKMIDADTEFFRGSKRSISQLSGLQKALSTEREKEAKERAEKEAEALENWNTHVHNSAIREIKTLTDLGSLRVEDAQKVEDQITTIRSESALERLAIAQKESDEEKARKKEQQEAIRDASVDLAAETANAVFEIRNSALEQESQSLERQKEYELSLAGDNKDKQSEIEAKFEKKQNELRVKKAKNDRNQALFNIAISTAENAVKLFGQTVPPGILSAIAIAFGAIQAGVVLSKPVPQFAKGTGGAYNTPGMFIAGEAGTEIVERGGKKTVVDRPTLFTGARGSRVYSNPELERLVRSERIGFDDHALRDELRNGFDRLGKVITSQKQPIIMNNRVVGFKQGNYTRTYLDRMMGN